jgi:hypothetical protein
LLQALLQQPLLDSAPFGSNTSSPPSNHPNAGRPLLVRRCQPPCPLVDISPNVTGGLPSNGRPSRSCTPREIARTLSNQISRPPSQEHAASHTTPKSIGPPPPSSPGIEVSGPQPRLRNSARGMRPLSSRPGDAQEGQEGVTSSLDRSHVGPAGSETSGAASCPVTASPRTKRPPTSLPRSGMGAAETAEISRAAVGRKRGAAPFRSDHSLPSAHHPQDPANGCVQWS